ncbi:MAG: hypothetical protein ETSY2_46175 [Candidatus Entotheonella gemina]|uniref:Dehydrogenase n=1 Tax=Candidatus Entotheonella gemina TaxID=1429439 RepID=W4LFQ3_9BACT|nr:MAG: hypothetical protein ETSY2_46175 [Candidatus Entotheonella gemina]
MLNDPALMEFRHAYYSLFVQLWWREPSADFIASLMTDMGERIEAAAEVHPLMGEGWRTMAQYLDTHAPEDAAEAYTHLFLGPYGPAVQPYESFYLTGYLFRAPLVNVRAFLQGVGLEKDDDAFAEPEDVLAFELEVMRWLVGKQMSAVDPDETAQWLHQQMVCLKHHVLVWVPACARDIEQAAQELGFYRGAAQLLRGFLEVERQMFWELDIEPVATLEEARRPYRNDVIWEGPSFDAGATEDVNG